VPYTEAWYYLTKPDRGATEAALLRTTRVRSLLKQGLGPGTEKEVIRTMSRIQNWDLGYKTDAVKIKLDARRPGMETLLTTIYADQEAIEGLVRGTLSGITGATSPSSIQSPFYQAAAKQMAKVTRAWAGGGIVDKEMAAVITKWSGRGLSSTVLTQIAYEVFHWTPPGP
jgi:hypothetical protein